VARKSKKSRRSFAAKLLIFGSIVALLVCLVYGFWAQTIDIKGVEQMEERSAVFDMDGKYYSRLKGENRVIVGLEDVSPFFIKALLVREDTRFYKHIGVDPVGIARAIVRNIIHLHVREGASTLTQQLARNSFPLGGKNLHRKLLEAFVALRIERNYTKKQILEFYVNRIYFGPGFYGIETASQIYFNKHAADLTLGESAMLAGLIRGPTKFSPFKNMKGALAQRDTVLDRMAELKKISKAQAESGKHSKLNIAKSRPALTQENYAMDAVMRDLDMVLTDDQVGEGGLKIYTTIDPQLQKAAQSALDGELRKIEQRPGWSHPKRSDYTAEMRDARQPTNYLQGAVMVVDNRDGGIRAIVGGRDFGESNFNRALLSPRQVGSTFKPFVYATAFARGALQPGTLVDDSPIRPGDVRGASGWSPVNSDGTYKGLLPAEDGLILSRNTMSARVGDMAGIDAVQRTALAVGIGKIPHLPSIFLGSFETTLKDLTTAYTVFPNGGAHQLAYIIERVDNSDGQVVYLANHSAPTALPPGICGEITGILQKVLDHGTAAAARSLGFYKSAAGKTGTTNDYRDAWFVGYTKSLTCGVWVGLDQPETIMAHGYGSALALPVWVDVMNAASSQRYPSPALPVFQGAAPPENGSGENAPRPRGNFLQSLRRFFGGK
jgi:penicillin-binding protein 1A